MIRAIIVDDEASARVTLSSILSEFFSEVELVGEAGTPSEAVELIRDTDPDVIFLDVQMQFGTGFDVLESVGEINSEVIFVSAHEEHAHKSFRVDAVDYLLKPVRIRDLREALEKLRQRTEQSPVKAEQAILKAVPLQQERLQVVLPDANGYTVVRLDKVVRCEAARNYTTFFLSNGKQLVASRTLKEFDDLLCDHAFARIHKSHLVNLRYVYRYVRGRGGEVEMEDGAILPVSRERKDALLRHFIQ